MRPNFLCAFAGLTGLLGCGGDSSPPASESGQEQAATMGSDMPSGAAASIDGANPSVSPTEPTGDAGSEPTDLSMRDVLLVANSVSGSISFLDAHTFKALGAVNVIPDFDDVRLAINLNPVRLVAYPIVRNQQLLHHFEPANGDRFVDDVFVSPAGDVLYVSRSNLGDVAAFDLTKPEHPQLWRTFIDGLKADHATLSADGSRLVVSATTARVADVIDTATGKVLSSFPTGQYPHQNDYSADGRFIYNSSIGNVGYNAVSHADNGQKGDRWLIKVDAATFEEVGRWVFEFGIRPNVITPDDKILYTQLSYLNGVIKYDLSTSKEIARSDQPLSEFALSTYATYDEYPHDSAHHGLALSGDGKHLCDCGTIDNTVTLLRTADMKVEHTLDVGRVPYWATTSPDGEYCFVSISADDAVSVIRYDTGELVTTTPVGKFPQRNRLARVPLTVLDLLDP